jgi:hypothetical protein
MANLTSTDVKKKKGSNRKVIVFSSLAGGLTLTSLLLLALAPQPLTSAVSTSLFAVDSAGSLEGLYALRVDPQQWRYIYIHQSQTTGGDAQTLANEHGLADHFVIGNGDGCVDGEIQVTQLWNGQAPVTNPPQGLSHMDSACISICLIGDFDQAPPTKTQQRRLAQLVTSLQSRLGIAGNAVWMIRKPTSPASIGGRFPVESLRRQFLP